MPPRREQQADALERKLTQIYDAFDSWNWKSAAKLSAAARQKHPDSHIVMALQSVALWRAGKTDEALQVADDLLAAGPTEEQVLRTLTLVLRPAGQGDRLAAAWEAASSQQPSNQELLLGTFQSALGRFDFSKQQQLALKLQKLAPSEKYQWWLVDLLALQARAAAGGAAAVMGQDKLLQLAASMGSRLMQAAQAQTPGKDAGVSREALMLHLGVLIAQGKHDDALQLLSTPDAAAALPMVAELREARAAVLQLAGNTQAAAELYCATLHDQPDDWNTMLLYMDCKVPGGTPGINYSSCMAVARELLEPGRAWAAPVSEVEADDEAWQEVAATISSQSGAPPPSADNGTSTATAAASGTSSSSRRAVLRGAQLAKVELCLRQMQAGRGNAEDLAGAVLEYYDRLGHTLSCAKDVLGYLPHLGPGAAAWLAAALQVKLTSAVTSGAVGAAPSSSGSTSGPTAAAAAGGGDEGATGSTSSGSSKAAVQLDQLRRQVAAWQIQDSLGLPLHQCAEEAAAHAAQLMALFSKHVHLYEGLDPREGGPADELLSLAAASLVAAQRLHHQSSSASSASPEPEDMVYILQAVVLLEAGVKVRPYSAPLRLGAAWLYGCLGCVPAVTRHFAALDCKHIQMDTVASHLLLPLLLGLGAGEAARKELKRTLALFRDHLQDAGDTLFKAYEHSTHTKVLEFVAFKERLERSHTFAAARAEVACLDVTQPTSSTAPSSSSSSSSKEEPTAAAAAVASANSCPLEHLESLSWQGMRYNADLAARLSWQAPVEGRLGGGVLIWWQQQRQAPAGPVEGADGCWWQAVSAAEADTGPAAAYRAALRAAAEGRWLLPHLLAAALGVVQPAFNARSSSSSSSAAGAADGSSNGGAEGGASAAPLLPHEHLQQLLPRYMRALGLTPTPAGAVASTAAEGGSAASSGGKSAGAMGCGLLEQLELVGATTFTLGAAVQELLHLLAQDSTTLQVLASTSHSLQQAATHLGQLLSVLQLQLLPLLRPAPGAASASASCSAVVLTGEVLSALALLLQETGLLLVVCLEAWCSSWRTIKKKTKAKKATPGQLLLKEPVVDASIRSLTQLQEQLTEQLAAIAGIGRQVLLVPASEQVQALLSGVTGGAGVEGLVGWQKEVGVRAILTDLEQQQRGLLQQCVESAEQLQQRLGSISW